MTKLFAEVRQIESEQTTSLDVSSKLLSHMRILSQGVVE
jgi:hypothetical protein